MLRYDGPIQLNNRRLLAPMALGGTTLPAGTPITIGIGAANRDPAQFPDPERFDVARKPNRHIAFGQGDHVCVGMNVARMEGRIAFSRLLARFPKIALNGQPERDRRVRFRGFRRPASTRSLNGDRPHFSHLPAARLAEAADNVAAVGRFSNIGHEDLVEVAVEQAPDRRGRPCTPGAARSSGRLLPSALAR